ncbi:hypothetical protein [Spirosoma aerophilum]
MTGQKVGILEQFLLHQQLKRSVSADRIDYATNRIVEEKGVIALDTFIEEALYPAGAAASTPNTSLSYVF